MHVHSDDNLRTLELVEGMLDAVSDVGCNTNLGLRHHIGGSSQLTAMFQNPSSLFLVVSHVLVFIYHIQADESPVQFLVSHQKRQTHQVVGIFRIFHRNQNLLIAHLLVVFCIRQFLVSQDNLLRRPVGKDG